MKGETIHDAIVVSAPEKEEIPELPKLPIKHETVYIDNMPFVTEKVDTAEIIKDYITQRTYAFNVLNHTLGPKYAKQNVGSNKLLSFDYTFTPMTKQVTQFREPLFTPFVTAGYSTNQSLLLGGGFYYKNIGLEYNMNVSTNDRIWSWQVDDPIIFNRLNKNEVYHTFKLNYNPFVLGF